MIVSLLFSLGAAAAPITPAEVQASVQATLGTPVTTEALCLTHPPLPEVFQSDLVAVGLRDPHICRFQGLFIGKDWHTADTAALAAIKPEVWANHSTAAKADALILFTRHVLLAFDNPTKATTGAMFTAPGKKGTGPWFDATQDAIVLHDVSYARAGSQTLRTDVISEALTFRTTGELIRREVTDTKSWDAKFAVIENGTANASSKAVYDAMQTSATRLQQCVISRWQTHPLLQDGAKLKWTITAGKASAFTVVGMADPDLTKCYAGVLGSTAFPADLSQNVSWTFAVRQEPFKDDPPPAEAPVPPSEAPQAP